ncbi:MAG: site-2 protease family protein, partial [Alphaproteobacteria bacterium]|nr:site-2 protease family protein [Alphaproteobacteria bacterium]
MFGRHVTLFHLLGFPIRVDASWLLLAAPIGWTLANGYFPSLAPDTPGPIHWLMALAGLVGLMASLVLHEFAHSVVARRHGMPIQAITLFLFGGVAEMEDEPATPRGELRMALAGPAMSVAIGATMFAAQAGWSRAGGSADDPVALVVGYLALINGLLATFNMIPAFPLDGGRVLRAVLWGWKGDVLWATRVAGAVGWLFGLALASAGAVSIVQGGTLAGFWWILLGFFVYAAARGAVAQQRTRQVLAAEPLSRFLRAP